MDCSVFPDFKVSGEKKKILLALENAGIFTSSGLVKDKGLANVARGGRHQAEPKQFEKKPSWWNVQPAQSNVDTEVEAANNGVPKGGKKVSAGFCSIDKSKVLRSGSLLPSTGIAAHMIEHEVEIEVEKFEENEMDSSGVKKGAINAALRNEDAIRLPPPPPSSSSSPKCLFSATKWTVFTLAQPLIDAIYMVDMFALVKNSTLVSVLEILHTYNTIAVLSADSSMAIVDDRVSDNGFL
ncbi:hypothetical protein Dsin_031620 [Dipteronia sinensis]|uniref:Uncharacterized protein n=1 Tax=Dipteronia sinensis TaxID=43782 RepID=A0AAD9ZN78_9ROSI|nr:hypothetical protein Dsin_031620 [Dipteronia sinensis]